jgi:hypothetical protein
MSKLFFTLTLLLTVLLTNTPMNTNQGNAWALDTDSSRDKSGAIAFCSNADEKIDTLIEYTDSFSDFSQAIDDEHKHCENAWDLYQSTCKAANKIQAICGISGSYVVCSKTPPCWDSSTVIDS